MFYFTTGVLFLLVFISLGRRCQGHECNLTTSSPSAVNGEPFAFKCSLTTPKQIQNSANKPNIIRLRHGSQFITEESPDKTCAVIDIPTNENYTCNITKTDLTLNIPRIVNEKLDNSNWTCHCIVNGSDKQSKTFTMNVEVPLDAVTLFNATSSPHTAMEGDVIPLVCETSPSQPPSAVSWTFPNQTLTRFVTSLTRDEAGLTVTVGKIMITADVKYNIEDIQCVGEYQGIRKVSAGFRLITHAPLTALSISINGTNDGTVILTCNTNPTYPPSEVFWMRGPDILSDSVTSQSGDDSGKLTTVGVLSASCAEKLNHVYCMGTYEDKNITSHEMSVNIQCHREPLMYIGAGAGVGIGIAVCGFLLFVVVLIIYLLRRRRRSLTISNDGRKEKLDLKMRKIEIVNLADVEADVKLRKVDNTYDNFDEATRQTDQQENYDDLNLYENTKSW